MNGVKLALASDHAGFALKEALAQFLESEGVKFVNVGTDSPNATDYPDWAFAGCKLVLQGECERAILICGTGLGMALAANKLPGIRAACCQDEYSAVCSREHNDANVLTLGSRVVGFGVAVSVVQAWLGAEFSGAARHVRRLQKVCGLAEKGKAILKELEES